MSESGPNLRRNVLNSASSKSRDSINQKDISNFLSSLINSSDLQEKASEYSILEFVKISVSIKAPPKK